MNAPSRMSFGSAARLLCVAALMLAAAGQAAAQSVLSLHDEAAGTTQVFTPGDTRFFVSGDGSAINVAAEHPGGGWYLRFEAPDGQTLAPGRYADAGCRSPLRMGRAPGLEVTDNNPACNFSQGVDSLYGSFVIRQINFNDAGNVVSLEALFTQRKGSATAPALGGFVRYEAKAMSFAVKSDPGFAWGAIDQISYGDTNLFTLDGTATEGMDYTASGQKETWRLLITPRTGQQLQARRYKTRGAADTSHAGLIIRRGLGGQPMACANPSGVLDIRTIRYSVFGVVLNLQADFVYRCGGTKPALRGTIRYLD